MGKKGQPGPSKTVQKRTKLGPTEQGKQSSNIIIYPYYTLFLIPYPLCHIPSYPASIFPYPLPLPLLHIHYRLSLNPYKLFHIQYPLIHIPYSSSLIPYPISLIPFHPIFFFNGGLKIGQRTNIWWPNLPMAWSVKNDIKDLKYWFHLASWNFPDF